MKDFIEELKWRGMLHDVIPGTEEHLEKNKTIGYINSIFFIMLYLKQ